MNAQHDSLPPDLQRVGDEIAALPPECPAPGLAQRTLNRLSQVAGSVKKESRWWLRNITHPAARIAAAVFLVALVGLFTNMYSAERIGRWVERMIGTHATDRIEIFVDRVLPTANAADPQLSDAAPENDNRAPQIRRAPKDRPASWLEDSRHTLET
jgi:hypothetical protein